MNFTNPKIQDFKDYFFRDFPYGDDQKKNVMDADLFKAYDQTKATINQKLFTTQAEYTQAFLWLWAHWLVIDLRASAAGIGGSYSWVTTSKSVGSVSESFAIPERILRSPYLSAFSQTKYGAKYIMLVYPRLIAQVFPARGRTLP